MLVVSESVSSELTFFPLDFRPIFPYMDIFTYLCLDVSEVSQTQQILNRLQCIINPSNRQKFIRPSAYPPIHSFIQVGNGIPHFLSLNYCIRSIACFVNSKCLIFFESLQISPALFLHLFLSDVTVYFIYIVFFHWNISSLFVAIFPMPFYLPGT